MSMLLSCLAGFIPSLHKVLLAIAALSVGISFYLGYILVVVLNDFCAVCTSLYIVNALLLINAAWNSCCGRRRMKQE